ncbi:hypothetical protein [Plantibacter sp. YIM 135249]|uniref:hypothetical protein n=1 Tax=Plantibacter sp. YIM 135249 TaxID=3423918 RepID=UPI003D33EEE3
MALKTGFPAVSGATQFPDLRLLFAGDIVCDTSGVPRAGVLPANFDPIVTGRADLKVDVAAMSYITVRSGGVIRGYNDGVAQVTLPALPTANSRIDILWVRQPMAASPTSDGSDVPLFGWTTGVASATPVRPSTALPAGALEIAQVQVAFNATATNDGTKVTITQTAPLTAFSGGIVPFRSTAERDTWTAAAGQFAAVSGRLFVSTGSGWVSGGARRLGSNRRTAALVIAGQPAWSDVVTLSANSSGGLCVTDSKVQVYNGNSGSARTASFRVTCDGVQVGDIISMDVPLTAGTTGYLFAFDWESSPAAGAHTWVVQARASAASAVFVSNSVMTVTEN